MKTRSFIASLIALQVLAVVPSQAAIVYSGLKDFTITTTFVGIYLDVDAGVLVAEEAAGWDINAFFSGEGIANSPAFQPVRMNLAVDSPVLNLSFGETVSGASVFAAGFAGSETHIGAGVNRFAAGNDGYIGFRLTTNASDGPFYGWMRLNLSNTGTTGLIRDWAYENTGTSISVGAVPEPSAFLTGMLGLLGACLRRRR